MGRERRSSGGGEEDEGRSRSLEAGGDRTRELRLRHQSGRGGQLLTKPSSKRKSLKCPPDSFNPVNIVSGLARSGFTQSNLNQVANLLHPVTPEFLLFNSKRTLCLF